jgi:PilZ domain
LEIAGQSGAVLVRRDASFTVLMSGAIEFAGSTVNCLVRNISISGAALDVTNPLDIPERFDLVFKADGTHIPCHVIWRQGEQIGVAFD